MQTKTPQRRPSLLGLGSAGTLLCGKGLHRLIGQLCSILAPVAVRFCTGIRALPGHICSLQPLEGNPCATMGIFVSERVPRTAWLPGMGKPCFPLVSGCHQIRLLGSDTSGDPVAPVSVICSELTGCRHPVTVTGWAPKKDGLHTPGTHTDCLLDMGCLEEWGSPGSYLL